MSRLSGIVAILATAQLLGAALPAHAQPATSLCNLPQMRGTAVYNRYCTGQSAPPMAPAAPVYDPTRSFKAPAVHGEFYVIKKDGRSLTAADMATVPFEMGDTMLTGPTGSMSVLLPDATVFTLGPNSQMEMDEFIFDPATATFNSQLIGVTKGVFRFVTAHIAPLDPDKLRIKVAVGTIGVRGTDVAFEQSPDGTGSVKLYSGLVELTPYDTDTTIELQAGQMITWTDFTKMSGPMPIQ